MTSAKRSFLDALEQRVLVCDGAMGTLLYDRGIFFNRPYDELNLTRPDVVGEVHRAYVEVGTDVIETNTFGANWSRLSTAGLAERVREINLEGVRLARAAAGSTVWVAGAIGPLGVPLDPEASAAQFRVQVRALVEGNVDLLMLETFGHMAELAAAIKAVKDECDLPIVAQVTTDQSGRSLDGTPPETFGPALEQLGAHVVGLNCGVGPAAMLETLERLAASTTGWLSAQPNAGLPRQVDGRSIYLSSPEFVASYARRFAGHRARLIGGCCGTTPEHLRAIRRAVDAVAHGRP